MTAGRGDTVMSSDTGGAFANRSVSVTGVNHDQNEAPAGDDRTVDPKSVVAGDVVSQKADTLLIALPGCGERRGRPGLRESYFPASGGSVTKPMRVRPAFWTMPISSATRPYGTDRSARS